MADEVREPERFFPGRHQIEAYGNRGFRFGGMSHRGSILPLPSGMRVWAVESLADIDEASLALILAEAAAIEMLLLGPGFDPAFL